MVVAMDKDVGWHSSARCKPSKDSRKAEEDQATIEKKARQQLVADHIMCTTESAVQYPSYVQIPDGTGAKRAQNMMVDDKSYMVNKLMLEARRSGTRLAAQEKQPAVKEPDREARRWKQPPNELSVRRRDLATTALEGRRKGVAGRVYKTTRTQPTR